jgi:hypothetical protein
MDGKKLLEKFDREYMYWTDGQKIFFKTVEMKGIDIETFIQYQGSWAKDKNYCYSAHARLHGADANSFTVLNYTYAKDDFNIWTVGGKIKDVDVETFVVCDRGKHSLGKSYDKNKDEWYELFVPYGYGKDKNNVYYYDSSGKPNIVKNASPETFISLDDNYFGYDENSVFCGIKKLQKANPKTWKKIKDLYYYSKDKNIVYYFNRIIKEADFETFEVLEKDIKQGAVLQLAKDKNNYYWNDTIITKEKIEELLK